MKAKLGKLLVLLGTLLILAALGLFLRNRQEQQQAAASSEEAIRQVAQVMEQRTQQPAQETQPQLQTMPVSEIDGYGYIGFLGIPSLELELPIMADWSYPQLQIAPCRYTGDMYSDDLVLMAHNYPKHFGKISELKTGDIITMTDMNAVTVRYQVVAKDVLDPTAVEEMTAGEYDLTLFTCTYGGASRVTVRCDRAIQ